MKKDPRQTLREGLRHAIAEQIRSGSPPATAEAFQRLRHAGHAEEEVWRMLTSALLVDMNERVRDHREFDPEIWRERLAALPRLVKR